MKLLRPLLAALLITTAIQATVLTELDTRDLTAQADLIVIGKCTGNKSRWEDRNLFTLTAIAVDEVLKGERRPSITVVLPGGVDLEGPVPIAMDYEGGPVISPGEEVLLFLRRIDEIPDAYTIVGFSQGKFSVRTDKEGKLVSRDLSGVVFSGGRVAPAGKVSSIPLTRFKEEIKKHLVASGAARMP